MNSRPFFATWLRYLTLLLLLQGSLFRSLAGPLAADDARALAEFSAWTRTYLEAQAAGQSASSATVEEGLRLAVAREPVFHRLMRAQPAEALAQALRWHEWSALPPELQAHVETPFSGMAEFSVIADCRPVNERGTPWPGPRVVLGELDVEAIPHGRRALLGTKLGTPLQGVALAGQAVLEESPAQRLEGAQLAAAQARFPDGNPRDRSWRTGGPLDGPAVVALIGGRLFYFANETELLEIAEAIQKVEELPGPDSVSGAFLIAMFGDYCDPIQFVGDGVGIASVWTETPKNVLGLRLAYSDAPATTPYSFAELTSQMNSSSNSLREMSFAKTHLVPTVTPVLVLPQPKAYYEVNSADTLATHARNAAAAAGFPSANYHIFVYCFPFLNQFAAAAGFAEVGGPNHWINGLQSAGVLTHEFGHNYGVVHANFWLGSSTGAGYAGHGFEHEEYGDLFDIMGSLYHTHPGSVAVYPNGHLSMFSKSVLNWIEPQEVHQATSNGTYRLRRFDHINSRNTAGGRLGLQVTTRDGRDLWVGYRRNFTSTASGAYIVWADTALSHRLLDATPLSVSNPTTDKEDAFLPPCRTFVDPSGSVRITTLGQGGSGADEYLDVAIELIPDQPDYRLFTAANLQTNGLLGSYVNTSLRSRTAQEDWRSTPGVTISGRRVDAAINFTSNGWGARGPLGLTWGSDADWENFSVQWDGYIVVDRPTRLATRSDDGSRMWIDLDGNGSFGATRPELVNNGWGTGQGATLGELSVLIPPGIYAFRLQYEEGVGANTCELLSYPPVEFDVFADAGNQTNGLIGSYVNSSLRGRTAQEDWRSTPGVTISGTRLDAYPGFLGNGWGARAPLGLTGGSDADWENFSVQWDGWLRVHRAVRLATRSDDGSRMWIDVDGNGAFGTAAPELVNNGWGAGQGTTLGPRSDVILPGNYRIRIQYEEGNGGNNFVLLGQPVDTPGLDHYGLSFDGVNDHVAVDLGTSLANNYTISAWVNLRAGGTFGGTRMGVLSGPTCGSTAEILIRSATASASDPQFLELGRCSSFSGTASSVPVPLNQWTHLTVTVSPAKLVTYYLNGRAAGSWTAGGDVTIGPVIHLGDNVSRKFDGLLEDVAIWNTALSAAQVQANLGVRLSGREAGLFALWRFDEGAGLLASDASGNGRHGTLVNGPTWTPSPVSLPAGHALCFDGVDDVLRLANAGLTMPTNEITIEFWQRVYETRAQATFSMDPDNSANRVLAHVPWSTGAVFWDFGNIGGAGRLSYVPAPEHLARWQHWAFVSSVAGGYQRIYRNGVQEADDNTAGQFARYAAALVLGGNGFKGELDEFRIWSVPRTVTQIRAGMSTRLPVPQSGLWAYWRFDEGGGTTAYDHSGNGRHATLQNGAGWIVSSAPLRAPTALPYTNVVTTLADDGVGSLRQAILNLNELREPGVITFAVNGTIVLASALPGFTTNVMILGPGTNQLTISGAGAHRLLTFPSGSVNHVAGLRLINGGSTTGGAALLNLGVTTLAGCVFSNHVSQAALGGAIHNGPGAELSATNVVFLSNRALGGPGDSRPENTSSGGAGGGGAGLGGAIFTEGQQLVLSGCVFQANLAGGGNGGNGGGNGSNFVGGNGGNAGAGVGGTQGAAGGFGGFGAGGGGGGGNSSAPFGNGGAGGFGGGGGGGGASRFGGSGGVGAPGGDYAGVGGSTCCSFAGGGGGGAGLGGALFARSGVVTILNCLFTGNVATNGVGGYGSFGFGVGANGQGTGGAIFNLGGQLTVANNTFSGNVASTGAADLDGSTRVTTLADSGPGSLRAAIHNAALRPGSDVVTFDPALSGGTIALTTAQLSVSDPSGPVTVTATNLPAGIAVSGEGARRVFRVAAGTTLTLDSLTVTNGFLNGGNIETGDGAGLINYGHTTILNSTFVGNRGRYGGALDSEPGATLIVSNSTLAMNSSTSEGGALWAGATQMLSHLTVASNTASRGALRLLGSSFLSHCLVAGNSGGDAPDIANGGSYTAAAFNLLGAGNGSGLTDGVNGNRVGTLAAPLDAQLGALRQNGGRTPTLLPSGGSPARDAGDPLLSGLGRLDQRGLPRVANARVDIGAVETGLRAYYNFDAFTSVDVLGGSTLTYQGSASGPWYIMDQRGQMVSAIALNHPGFGTDNYYLINTPGDATNSNRGLGLQGDFTVSVWVYPRVLGGWKVVLGSTSTPGGPGTPVFGFYDDKAYAAFWANDLPGRITVSENQWIHLAWTYDSHGGQMALYVNGRLDNSAVGRPNTTLDANALLGYSAAIPGSYFQGRIDEFAIFNEALSASQIAALAAPNGPFPDAPLPAPVLSPGLVPYDCGWQVRELHTHAGNPESMPFDLPSAAFVSASPQFGQTTNYVSLVVARRDPETNPGGGYFGPRLPFAANNLTPQGLINGDDNFFVLAASTVLEIADEDDYTFGFASDDGAQLRIKGAHFSSSTSLTAGNPAVPAHRGDTLAFPGNTPNSLTLGVVRLHPGLYDVEFITWELGGGAFCEVFAARGAKTALDMTFAQLSPTLFAPRPTLEVERLGAEVRVSWSPGHPCDRLQSAPTASGPWTDVPGGVSGQLFPLGGAQEYFRVAH